MAAMTEAEMMEVLLMSDSDSDDDGPSNPPGEEKKQAEDKEEEDKEQDEEDEEKDDKEECLCCICLVNKADSAPTPCGHVCGCQSCLETVMGSNRNNCPICRARIEGIQRVHLSVAPSSFRSTSQAVAEPFKSYGISRRDARRALDKVDNDIAAAGRRLVQLAFQQTQEVDVEGLTAKIVAATEANDCKGVVDAMREGLFSEVVVGKGIVALLSFASFNADNQKRIAEVGGIEMILSMMEKHGESNAEVARAGCGALGNLAANAANQKRIAEVGGIEMILSMMEKHGESDAGVARAGCDALWSLSYNNKRKILAANGVSMVERMKSKWASNEGVQTIAEGALGNLR